LDLAELRARLDGTVPETFEDAITAPAASEAAADLAERPTVAAAVLVPIVHGPEPGILLTKRTSTLSSHAGQVAFPGGRMDPGETAEQTALREACEEVGLPSELVEVTGRLADIVTGTGFRITPVVGLLAPGFVPVLAAAEVEEVFTLPLSVLLDPAAPELRQGEWKGRTREFWVWPHTKHYIWGATAAILVHLARRLRAAGVA
jgi:8-oxo-dGTP pyrophosphatase MutT (NUDIX family)